MTDFRTMLEMLAGAGVDLPALVAVERAAGRPKDLEAIAELEALMREADGGGAGSGEAGSGEAHSGEADPTP